MALDIAGLPETTAIVQTPTTRHASARTDDLGFTAFTHPILSSTITYRREVFYPLMAWADVSSENAGLTMITHGLQGLGGTDTLNLMLVRDVSDGGRPTSEGVKDRGYHTLRYAYLLHTGNAAAAATGRTAYAFNQPLIAVWQAGNHLQVQLPFMATLASFPVASAVRRLPPTWSLISADNGSIADLYHQHDRLEAVVLAGDPNTTATLSGSGSPRVLAPAWLTIAPVVVSSP